MKEKGIEERKIKEALIEEDDAREEKNYETEDDYEIEEDYLEWLGTKGLTDSRENHVRFTNSSEPQI